MSRIQGRLFSDGREVLTDVRVALEFHRMGPLTRHIPWRGTIDIPPGQSLQAGGPYELRLGDGRHGHVLVCRSAVAVNQEAATRFVGTGPLETASAN